MQTYKYYKDIRKEILASGDARVIEVLSLFPDEALVKLKRILNKAGEVSEYITMQDDITERKSAEIKIKKYFSITIN